MRILVGMSGGFDSTYAALKLKREGHTVEGAVLLMHEYTETDAARAAANAVGIPLHIIDARSDFDTVVRPYFVEEYRNARTPNPCIICNERVKFAKLYEFAVENGFDFIATGHYAKVVKLGDGEAERYTFKIADDAKKDQTYMLYRLPQRIIKKLILPLSGEVKSELRESELAKAIPAKDKGDSQEICFIPDGDYASYIEKELGTFPEGDFVDAEGRVLGRHKGIIRYTVGQRKGLGIALGERAFVTGIDLKANTVTLSLQRSLTDEIKLRDIVYTGLSEREEDFTCQLYVKIRYQAKPVKSTVTFHSDGTADVKLSENVASVTAGQSAVMYDGGILMAGGIIC